MFKIRQVFLFNYVFYVIIFVAPGIELVPLIAL